MQIERRKFVSGTLTIMTGFIAGCMNGGNEDDGGDNANDSTEGGGGPEEDGMDDEEGGPTPSLEVSAQRGGSNVTIESASINRSGWLVIHPEGEGGGPEASVTLATKQLEAGEYTDIKLSLEPGIEQNATLYAMLHYDEPQDGQFSFPQQGDPGVQVDGNTVIKSFNVTTDTNGPPTSTVIMRNTAFQTNNLEVDPGTRVVWVNEDGYAHTVTSDSENWDKDTEVQGGGRTSHTFENEGVYEVTCSIHPSMSMTVNVGNVSMEDPMTSDNDGGLY